MATINLLSNGSQKSCDDMKKVIAYIMREGKTTHESVRLVSGIGCPADSAYTNMMMTKHSYHKTDGRLYYHLVQSFSPDEDITPELAHKVACEFAEKQFPGYEIVVGTHVDRDHIHSHILFNSVGFKDGKKYHSNRNDINRWRETSDEICRKHGLSVVVPRIDTGLKQPRAREFRAIDKQNSWKLQLVVAIEDVMKRAKTREEFMKMMAEKSYQVTWTDNRKNITYTTPEGKKCRDNKLHETKFLKEMMSNEFRIRQQILRSEGSIEERNGYGSSGYSVRDDHRTELERDGKIGQDDRQHAGSHGDQRRNGETHGKFEHDNGESDELAGVEGQVYSRESGEKIERSSGRYEETGWEAERRICFSSSADQEVSVRRYQDIFGADITPVLSSGPCIDVALRSAALVADAADLIDPADPDIPSNPSHMDKKEWEKLAEKNEAHGIKMG